ncbi:MAG TPA: CPBP family intramembrane glutamic endopeptidase [Euzebyales bacterium]|nr:CPBP family intramembrane glutamic endopeptidase [Euzebyales bacterium]
MWPTDEPLLVGLQFGSFLLVLGGILAGLWRESVGLGAGRTFAEWRLVLLWGAVLSAVVGLYVNPSEANPYSNADALFEVVLVPLGEELVFRGLLLSWLMLRLGRRFAAPSATRLAVGYSAVAFGAAHASNALFGVGGFALLQVAAATLLGLLFGHLRVRTGSLLAPVLLHALVNGIILLG